MIQLIRRSLFNMQDIAYRDFHSRLIPNIDKNRVIGVRTPILRKYTKEISACTGFDVFLDQLPHFYYEEDNIHAFYIESLKDFNECVFRLEAFLPYIDNWATCDMLRPKCFKNNTEKLFPYIQKWLSENKTYTVRFAIGMFNSYYLDEHFDVKHLDMVSSVVSDEYYINMMRAWYFSTALAKQYEASVTYVEGRKLDAWTHNKAIQKAIESYRISAETKEYLKTLKV